MSLMDLEKSNSPNNNPTTINDVSNKISLKYSNNLKEIFSKESINFETQSSSDHISRNYSKYDKSPISVQKIEIENDKLNQTSHFLKFLIRKFFANYLFFFIFKLIFL